MTTPVQPQTLEQRITARLHESIGDLVTEADLKDMVARGIDGALFKPRVVENVGYYRDKFETKPSIVDELVTNYLEERMRAAVDAWLKANPERIEAAIGEAMVKGAGACMITYLDNRMASVFQYGIQNLQGQGLIPRAPGT